MIEEQAQVIELRGNQLILQAQTQSSCASCAVNQSCGTSVLSKVVGRKFTQLQAENNIGAKVGDTVIVGIAEDALLKGSLVMYVIPIIGMLVFALVADYLLMEMRHRDLVVAISGLTGLAFGSLLARLYFQRQSNVRLFLPVVLRKASVENESLHVVTTSP
jgi:sigma-E factor negative regulatory protein RseC